MGKFIFNRHFWFILLWICIIVYEIHSSMKRYHGFIDNKTVTKENTPIFRDIPCNKDIFYAHTLLLFLNPRYNKANLMSALFLKWINDGHITVIKKDKLELKLSTNYPYTWIETKIYNELYLASKDGILTQIEFRKLFKKNTYKFLGYLGEFVDEVVEKLAKEKHIYPRKNCKECKYPIILDDKVYNDYKELYGLKLFLDNFTAVDLKEIKDVHLLNEYLMFACLFGNADKVVKELQDLNLSSADVIEELSFDFISEFSVVLLLHLLFGI